MREIILLLAVLCAVHAHAQPKEKKLKLAPPGQSAQTTEDPGSATRLLYEDPRNKNSLTAGADKKAPSAGIKSTCTDNMGMSYKQGDAGYDGCLRAFPTNQPTSPTDKRPSSLGITIGQ